MDKQRQRRSNYHTAAGKHLSNSQVPVLAPLNIGSKRRKKGKKARKLTTLKLLYFY